MSGRGDRWATRGLSLREKLEFHSATDRKTGCRLWTSVTGPGGHGRLKFQGRFQMAHRLAWQQKHGPIPKGLCVCHRCDVPACINPKHLFLGTHSDNTQDMLAKGRHFPARGEQSGAAKVTAAEVRSIRSDARPNVRIALDYGLDPSAISRIKSRDVWKHI